MEGNNQNNQQDSRLIQPEIIGELRKEKIGKPLIVIELFLLFGIVFAALPMVNKAMQDENSELYKWVHQLKGDIVTTTLPATETFSDASQPQLLNAETQMKYNNELVIKDVTLVDGQIFCVMYTVNNGINLDEKDMYLEITSSSGNVLGSVKLVGEYDNVETNTTLNVSGITFNPNMSYKGKVVEMTDDLYPAVELNKDEFGYADYVCTKGSRTITYRFQNDYLIQINDLDYVKVKSTNNNDYMNKLSAAQDKASKLGATVASVEEVADGFQFKAELAVGNDYEIPTTIKDYDYYPQETLAKKIAYAQKGKGYDCK